MPGAPPSTLQKVFGFKALHEPDGAPFSAVHTPRALARTEHPGAGWAKSNAEHCFPPSKKAEQKLRRLAPEASTEQGASWPNARELQPCWTGSPVFSTEQACLTCVVSVEQCAV